MRVQFQAFTSGFHVSTCSPFLSSLEKLSPLSHSTTAGDMGIFLWLLIQIQFLQPSWSIYLHLDFLSRAQHKLTWTNACRKLVWGAETSGPSVYLWCRHRPLTALLLAPFPPGLVVIGLQQGRKADESSSLGLSGPSPDSQVCSWCLTLMRRIPLLKSLLVGEDGNIEGVYKTEKGIQLSNWLILGFPQTEFVF